MLLSNSMVCLSQMGEVDRIAKRNTITVLYPEVAFDKNEAKLAIDRGTATIRDRKSVV